MDTRMTRCIPLILSAAVVATLVSCGRQQADNAEMGAPALVTHEGQVPPAESVREVWMPDYSDRAPSVLQMATGQLRPGIRKEIQPKDANSAELWAAVVREVGDVAWDTGSGDLLIASGKSAVVSETPLETLADQDLSGKLQNRLIVRRAEAQPGTHVLLKTVGGTYALLRIGTVHDRRLEVFWIDQPNGSARFSREALAALAAAGKDGAATVSVLTDVALPEGKVLDMSKAAIVPSPMKTPEPLGKESQEDALRAIRKVADLVYCSGRLTAGSEKMVFLGRGQLADYAVKNAAGAIRRRGGAWLMEPDIGPGSVFVVMTRDGKYALCRVLAKEDTTISIRWVMQGGFKSAVPFPVVAPDPPAKVGTRFDKLPKDPTARLQQLVSISPYARFQSPPPRAPILAEIRRVLAEGADVDAFQDPLGYNALHLAAYSGAVDAVGLLLDAGAKVDGPCRGKGTALHIAAAMNREEVCKVLLEHGADPQAKDANGDTPLALALQRSSNLQNLVGKDRVVPLLTERGGGPQSLHAAALVGDVGQIKAILAKGADVNQRDPQGKTPLYIAAEQGKADAAAALLDAKADANLRAPAGQYNWTPLIAAAFNGHANVVQVLLAKDAKITAEDKHKALYNAVSKWHVDASRALVEHGASYREKMNGDGPYTILDLAWMSPNPDLPALFLARGERMPLWAACYRGDAKAVQELLAAPGVDPNKCSPDGLTPLHLAVQHGHLDVIPSLLDKGADVNLPITLNKRTALHLAVEAGNLDAVKLLVARKANINALADIDRTPLYYAAVLRRNASIVKTLLDAGADPMLIPEGDRQSGKTKLSELTHDKEIQKILREYEAAK